MTSTHTRRDLLRTAAVAPLAVVLPFGKVPANSPEAIDPDGLLEYPERLGRAIEFAQWNLATCVNNEKTLGQPWPYPVETLDWNEGDGPQFVIVCQHPSAEALDEILGQCLGEIASTNLPIVDVARTECGRAGCFILAATRKLFIQRKALAMRDWRRNGGDA